MAKVAVHGHGMILTNRTYFRVPSDVRIFTYTPVGAVMTAGQIARALSGDLEPLAVYNSGAECPEYVLCPLTGADYYERYARWKDEFAGWNWYVIESNIRTVLNQGSAKANPLQVARRPEAPRTQAAVVGLAQTETLEGIIDKFVEAHTRSGANVQELDFYWFACGSNSTAAANAAYERR